MKKRSLSRLLPGLVFLLGVGLLLYPTVSDLFNSLHQSRVITDYTRAVTGLDAGRYEASLADARRYNESLSGKPNRFFLTEEELREYNALLNLDGSGLMGCLEIPAIDCSLPIYHGTGEAVLQIGVGHLEGASLPVGGAGTHCVLSGHRGLPSARLFTDLDKLTLGDTFQIRVLEEVLTYEIDQILTVLPEDTEALGIEADCDFCTLITCTPYGINTHRLLVRGHRVEAPEP